MMWGFAQVHDDDAKLSCIREWTVSESPERHEKRVCAGMQTFDNEYKQNEYKHADIFICTSTYLHTVLAGILPITLSL